MIRIIILAIVFLLCSGLSYGDNLVVVDGDTIKIRENGKWKYCRLYGIDAPELSQSLGIESKQLLEFIVKSPKANINIIKVGEDRYKRSIIKIYIMTSPTNGVEVNQFLVANGFAWWYKQYAPKNSGYKIAEDLARRNKKGVWSESDPTPPWEYRKRRK